MIRRQFRWWVRILLVRFITVTVIATSQHLSVSVERFREYLQREIPVSEVAWPYRFHESFPFLMESLLDRVGADVGERGFAVVDGLVGRFSALRAYTEASRLQAGGRFATCSESCEAWSCGTENAAEDDKRGDRVLWEHQWEHQWDQVPSGASSMVNDTTLHGLRDVVAHIENLGRILSERVPRLRIDSRSRALLSYYGDGQGYLPHFDNPFPSISQDPRLVTVLYYLNDGWAATDGGHLRVEPRSDDPSAPGPASGVSPIQRNTAPSPVVSAPNRGLVDGTGGPDRSGVADRFGGERAFAHKPDFGVEIAPELDRWVIMDATRTRHQVMPVRRPRYALTVWLTSTALDTTARDRGQCVACFAL